MSTTTKEEVLELFQGAEFRQKQREIQAIRKDIATARGIIADGRARYIKKRLRLRSKKAAEENPFADLANYNSREDIRNAYGWEMLSEAEMDRLMALWDAKEASLSTAGTYEDRVTQMLERALNAIGDEYIDQLSDFQELERQMEAEAERIARENQQRDWERKHGGGAAHEQKAYVS